MIKKMGFLFIVLALSLSVSLVRPDNPKIVPIYKKINILTIAEVVHFRQLPLMAKGVVKYLVHGKEIGLKNIYEISDKRSRKQLNVRVLYYEPKKMIKFQIFLSELGEGKVITLRFTGKEGRKLKKQSKREKEINAEMSKILSREHNIRGKDVIAYMKQIKLIAFGIDKFVTKYW